MFLSAKVIFDDQTVHLNRLLIRAQTEMPREWLRLYKKNVVGITPMKTGALRRSIITQALGTTASVSWRAPYAQAQQDGGHTVPRRVMGENTRDGGFGIIPARFYRYSRYTTAGTGPRFGSIAFQQTNDQIPAILRELGLTQ